MITSGSWRRKARSAAAEGEAAFSLTLTWLMPARLISAGVLGGGDVLARLLSRLGQVYSDTVLPEPVGPVTRIMP